MFHQFTKIIRIVFTFYRQFIFISLIISIYCFYLFLQEGLRSISSILSIKTVTLGLFFLVIRLTKSDESYYYRNLGFNEKQLWLPIIIFEILFLLTGIFIILQIRAF